MSSKSIPVASRTRSKRRKATSCCVDSKRRKTLAADDGRAKTKMSTPDPSFNGDVSLSSQKETAQVRILIEESDDELGDQDGSNPQPGVIWLSSDDDNDDEEYSEDDDSMAVSDDDLSNTSGEDSSDPDDLDYYEEQEEEDPRSSSSSEDDAETSFSETSSRFIVKRKAVETEFVGELSKECKMKLSGSIGLDGSITMSEREKFDLLSFLAESIVEKQDLDLDSNTSQENLILKEENEENILPLKFTFGVEEEIIPEKTEFEKEIDYLWSEMHLSMVSEFGSTSTLPSMVENEVANVSESEHDRTTLSRCRQGDHNLVLDEEVGMKCKFCSFLLLDIKDMSPPFMADPCGKYERQFCGNMDSSIFDGLQCEDSNLDIPGIDHSANIEGTVWGIIPDLKRKLYPHQHEGFEFIWNNIAGGIYRDKSKNSSKGGGGCIISHAPGTGKTLLMIVFLQTYLNEYPSCRPVIVAPRSMLLTWEAEFRKWKVDIPFHNLNTEKFSGKEKLYGIGLYEKFKHRVPYQDRPLARRMVKLLSWKSDGGILGISYNLFVQLAGKDIDEKQKCTTVDKHVSKILLELPGLFVLDEGHTPRNDDTLMWKALSRIKTERRIILSGTPFQNNFDELFNTLRLVRPKFAEGIQYRHRVEANKKCSDEGSEAKRKWDLLTDSIGKDDIYEAEKLSELKAVIKPFVHVHKGTILQTTLPGLRHSVVVLRPSNLQIRILERVKETRNPFLREYYVSLISTHPSLLLQLSNKKDITEIVGSIVSMNELEMIRLKPDKGIKTKFLMELLKLSGALDEKVLVFSQYLEPLNLIVEQLKFFFKWKEMDEILYMDGQCEIKQRQRIINVFNDPKSKARVLLASTRACSEGINLVGGSRVVLLDVTWNPSVERQAICRAYRLGQKRVVYTYHLISSGTIEGLKCYRQAEKDRLSELLFYSSHKGDVQHNNGCNVPEDRILEVMAQQEKFTSMIERIINEPKDSDLIVTYGGL
ncbi:SNF2 domain-containing protein CLASSY 3-like [Hibiscus syriacus]|uniref:SNF2 domain-containing protein CLASSY 3-like n=1 Tax=Hibiscus syriacus TaxID=106335 RepID=UPI00192117EE|nr:SNF2 domain-containing protein CLASSY 3-like [Hibiscus syriacus]